MELNIRRKSSIIFFALTCICGIACVVMRITDVVPLLQRVLFLSELWDSFVYAFGNAESLWRLLLYSNVYSSVTVVELFAVFFEVIQIFFPPVLILLAYYLNHTENNQVGCLCGMALIVINLLKGIDLGSVAGGLQFITDIGFPLLIMGYSVSDGEYRYGHIWWVICAVLCLPQFALAFLAPAKNNVLIPLTHIFAFLSFPHGAKALQEEDIVYSSRKEVVEMKEPTMKWHSVNTYICMPLCALLGAGITALYAPAVKDLARIYANVENGLLRFAGRTFPHLIVLLYAVSTIWAVMCVVNLHNKKEKAIRSMRDYFLFTMLIYFVIFILMVLLYTTISHLSIGLVLFLVNLLLLVVNSIYYFNRGYMFTE